MLGKGYSRRRATALFFILALGGCNTTGPMEVPKPARVAAPPVAVPLLDQPTLALGKTVIDLPPGQVIAHLPRFGVESDANLCNYRTGHGGDAVLTWASGARDFGDWRSEFGPIFFNLLRDRGVRVVGDPKALFRQDEEAGAAEILVGARIHEIRGNFCEADNLWDGQPLGEYSGEMFVRVEWSLYSTLTREVLSTFGTTGYAKRTKGIRHGIPVTFRDAFAAATEALLAEKAFVDALRRHPAGRAASLAPPVAGQAGTRETDIGAGAGLSIRVPPPFTGSLTAAASQILPAVVTVRSGTGHGSGFLISRDGHLLTNAHVVLDADRVQAVFRNGVEVTGEVIARDRRRDVALVKLPVRGRNVLPVSAREVTPLEDVYAIGSPISEDLAATVTRGVVSALRVEAQTGLRFIQSDASISPGSSGGPLVDRAGNAVGIAVASYGAKNAQNLNMFIPVGDAIAALRLQLVPTDRR